MTDHSGDDGVPPPARPDLDPGPHVETRRQRDERIDAAFAAAAEREEEQLASVRRRRAEPPPTVERKIVATPRMEWLTIAALLGAVICAAGFIVFYVAVPDTQMLGMFVGLGFACLGVAAVLAGKRLVPQEKVAEDYHWYGDEELQEDVVAITEEATEGISRRKLLAGATATAGLTMGAALAFPVASLGPNIGKKVYETPWRRGRRVVKENGDPLLADEVKEGTFFTAFAEDADRELLGTSIIVLRFPPEQLKLPAGRSGSTPRGIIAYSKICPHAGCAISMFRQPQYGPSEPHEALVCPCHYSTFDPMRGGHLLFGPAGRNLPQLPLEIDSTGALTAGGDFFDPIGPSYGGIRLEDRRRT